MKCEAFRVFILSERGNCLFDYDPHSLPALVDAKDLCRLIASLANFAELDDFCFMRSDLAALSLWTTRRGEVLWTFAQQEDGESNILRLVLLKMFVVFLRNCPILGKLIDTERLETQRSMNFTYRSVTSESSLVEVQQFPQYRTLLDSFAEVYSRFEAVFSTFSGCIFDYSESPLFSREFTSSASCRAVVEGMVRKLQEECVSEVQNAKVDFAAADTLHSYLLCTRKDICGLVACSGLTSKRQTILIQPRGDVKVITDKAEGEFTALEGITAFLKEEFEEPLPDTQPSFMLAKPAKIIDSIARSAFEKSEPSIVLSQYGTANLLSLNETAIQESSLLEGARIDEESEDLSFLQEPAELRQRQQNSLFSTELTLNRVLEQLDKTNISSCQLPQDLDAVPKKSDAGFCRRASETILTQVSRKPPTYPKADAGPKQPPQPRPIFMRRMGSGALSRTRSMRSLQTLLDDPAFLAGETGVFNSSNTQLEKYALEYHRPRRTGLMYSGEETSS